MTWSCPVCGTVNQDYRRKCTARDCRHPGGPPSAWDNRRVTAAARARRRLRPVDDGRVPIAPTRITRGEVIATVAVAGRQHWGTWKQWRWQSCKEAGSASDFRRLPLFRGGDSLSSEAMAVEDAGPAKAEEQDIANLQKARGGKPDVAIDEVFRQKRLERQELKGQMQSRKSTKALPKAAIAAKEKAVIKLQGLQKEEMDLTQLLKQQEISDAKCEAAEKAREVETLQARLLAERSIAKGRFLMSHLLHLAPRGRSSQVRGVVQ